MFKSYFRIFITVDDVDPCVQNYLWSQKTKFGKFSWIFFLKQLNLQNRLYRKVRFLKILLNIREAWTIFRVKLPISRKLWHPRNPTWSQGETIIDISNQIINEDILHQSLKWKDKMYIHLIRRSRPMCLHVNGHNTISGRKSLFRVFFPCVRLSYNSTV